jgi:acetolactate synthase-1/2/3 large subunit
MGKGAFDEHHPLAVGMLGMHGTAYANFAVSECDLLIAAGARALMTASPGKLDDFAPRAQVIHIDIDPAEVGKNRTPHVPIVGGCAAGARLACCSPRRTTAERPDRPHRWPGGSGSNRWRTRLPAGGAQRTSGVIAPQEVIAAPAAATPPTPTYTTDVGQHQMWAAQFLQNGPAPLDLAPRLGHHGLRHAGRHGGARSPCRDAAGRSAWPATPASR